MDSKGYEEENTLPITERPNELTRDIDVGSAGDIVRILRQCDSQIFSGWKHFQSIYDEEIVFAMEKVVEKAAEVLQQSGAVVLSGCGTSGRIAFFLAQKFSKLVKEQGLSASYEYLIAGGDIALFMSQEAPEDDWRKGQEDLSRVSSNKTRVLYIGITCGLSAPYVAGQLDYCMNHPDVFIPVLLGFNPVSQARRNVIEGWSKSFYDVACALQGKESMVGMPFLSAFFRLSRLLDCHQKTNNFKLTRAYIAAMHPLDHYTCQLFLRYKREIFILGVLGFFKTTRSFPKIPEEVRSLP